MLKYLIRDLAGTVRYLPYGIVAGIGLLFLVMMINKWRQKQGKAPVPLMSTVCFYTFLALMIIITFLSREGGDVIGMDLQIGSTLTINVRNNAYLIENIILFMPYGFFFAWYYNKKKVVWQSFELGLLTSLSIEVMQFVTGRGLFQIDDILTNTLGCVIGAILFKILNWFFPR